MTRPTRPPRRWHEEASPFLGGAVMAATALLEADQASSTDEWPKRRRRRRPQGGRRTGSVHLPHSLPVDDLPDYENDSDNDDDDGPAARLGWGLPGRRRRPLPPISL
jgi:hypothetical protein